MTLPAVIPRGNKNAIMDSIVDSYRVHKKEKHYNKYKKTRKNVKKIRKYQRQSRPQQH